MRITTAVAALIAWLVWAAVPLLAHHSFQSTFDIDKPVRLEGKVTQLNWGNPHVTFDMAVTDSRTGTATWRIELPSANDLFSGGLNRYSISVGGDIAVGGYAARSGEPLVGASVITMKASGMNLAIPVERSWKRPEKGDERYNNGEPVKLTGKVVSLDLVNPIPSVRILVTIPNVSEREWIVETVSTSTLEQLGWNKLTLAPGDVIQVGGKEAASGARKVYALNMAVVERDGKALASPITILTSTPLK